MQCLRAIGPCAGAVLLALTSLPAAQAIVTLTDEIELEGFVNLQNVVREPRFESAELVMQRNTAQIEGKYYFLKDSTAFGRFHTGRLEEATLTIVGRGVYDSIYDIRDSYRDAFDADRHHPGEAELKLREAFIDFLLPPFTLRLGRQQVVWGETDNFRALDVINPLDLRWHWSWESWEDIRIPLWMARGVYDIGKLGPFDESFIEGVYIPWDVQQNEISTDPRRPWALHGAGLRERANTVIAGGQVLDLDLRVRDGSPSRRFENGQGGMRFKAIWGDVEFSLNYFYGFSVDTRARYQAARSGIFGNTFRAEYVTENPRTHLVGFTANYSEEKYTQAVFRMETVFTTGVPVAIDDAAPRIADPDGDQFDEARRTVLMLAVDRPTWIRWLNDQRTFFLSTQIFWRHYLDWNTYYRGIPAVEQAVFNGQVLPDRYVSTNTDRIDQNEFVMTFSASTSYGAAGLMQPRFVLAYDPRSTGAYNQIGFDYLLSKHIQLKLYQNLFWRVNGDSIGPWQLGDLWGHSSGNSRHETVFSLIYQF